MATPALSTGQSSHPDPPSSIGEALPTPAPAAVPPTSMTMTSKSTSTSTSTGGPLPPNLVRRSSFEPMRLGLGSLPPPVFSRAPPGQRSVPAIEFLNKDSTTTGITVNTTTGSSSVPTSTVIAASGTNTPGGGAGGIGLGNGSMTSEPWNLWSDSTVPITTSNNNNNTREDNELASALAAIVILDGNNDNNNINKRSSISSRVSSSSTRSRIGQTIKSTTTAMAGDTEGIPAADGNVAASSWPEGLSPDPAAALQPQSFALDPNASPDGQAGDDDLSQSAINRNTPSILPRNVSFSSMLDLPKPDQIRLSTMDNIGPTGVVGGGLERKGSLTRRITSNTQSPLATLPSSSSSPSTTTTTTGNTFPSTAQPPSTTNTTGNTSDSLPLPSLGFSVPSAAGAASPYTPPATSYGTTLKGSGSASPNQSKSGNNAINYTSNSMIDGTTGRPALGIDEYGIRFRQGTNMSNNTAMTSSSDYSFSNTSIAFGTLNQNDNNSSIIRGVGGFIDNGFGNLGLNDQQQLIGRNDNAQPPPIFGNNSGAFNSLPPRRDSGYAHSLYNNNNNNNHNNPSPSIGFGNFGPAGNEGRRGSRSTSWQFNSQFGSPMNRGISSYSYSPPPPPPNPYTSPFSLTPDGGSSFMTLNSSSSGTTTNSSGNSSSLLRYPSLNGVGGIGNGSLDYLLGLGMGGFGGNGLALPPPPPPPATGPLPPISSPFMRFPNSLPNLGLGAPPGYMFAGVGNNDYDRPRLYEEKNRPIRSPLLEEFRADKLKRWGVRDMQGYIAEFMCDQVGSRYIQESILEHPTSQDCDLIFEELVVRNNTSNNNNNNNNTILLNLSIDVFANFCVQKLLEKSSLEQVFSIVECFRGNVLRLSLQTYGCRVIQKAIEVASPDHQVMILHELEGAVQKCVRDQNANHVIQKIVTTCPPDLLQIVVDAFVGNVYTFATHPYSCRVLQRILENCPERMTRPILEELKSYALNLMQDQYGNYVIQFCLERGLPHDKSDIICQIYGQVLHFSKHKFASNVIEKCIMNANDHELNMIASEVLAPGMDGNTGIHSMLRHEYANYPLQRLIKHTSGPIHGAIVEQVSIQLAMFRDSNPPFNAKHLVAVEKLLVDIAPSEFPGLMRRRFEDHYISRR